MRSRTTGAARRKAVAAALACVGVAVAGPAVAGDYYHQCRSADGGYVMNDEQLQAFDAEKNRETGAAITYKVLRRVELSKRTGYCVARKAPGGPTRFKHVATNYALQVRFRRNGQQTTTFMLCEMVASGLPAAYNCDREVTTLDWTIANVTAGAESPEPQQPADNAWFFRGAMVDIEARGHRRRIVVVTPGERLARVGVQRGDVIFDGERDGDRYFGRAYAYRKRCRPKSFSVSGEVQPGERQVIVTGERPVLDRRCRIIDREDARLVFERR